MLIQLGVAVQCGRIRPDQVCYPVLPVRTLYCEWSKSIWLIYGNCTVDWWGSEYSRILYNFLFQFSPPVYLYFVNVFSVPAKTMGILKALSVLAIPMVLISCLIMFVLNFITISQAVLPAFRHFEDPEVLVLRQTQWQNIAPQDTLDHLVWFLQVGWTVDHEMVVSRPQRKAAYYVRDCSRLIDWSINWLNERLIEWTIDWLIDWLIGRFLDHLLKPRGRFYWSVFFYVDNRPSCERIRGRRANYTVGRILYGHCECHQTGRGDCQRRSDGREALRGSRLGAERVGVEGICEDHPRDESDEQDRVVGYSRKPWYKLPALLFVFMGALNLPFLCWYGFFSMFADTFNVPSRDSKLNYYK